ncbi:hypothetical protein M0R45_004136 [Rubus argutus]|uniref:Uncharacterized protein n=1 Tax=Rubus argutus TaxID=59490 RepID=A0AAW1YIX3_RUBAR
MKDPNSTIRQFVKPSSGHAYRKKKQSYEEEEEEPFWQSDGTPPPSLSPKYCESDTVQVTWRGEGGGGVTHASPPSPTSPLP